MPLQVPPSLVKVQTPTFPLSVSLPSPMKKGTSISLYLHTVCAYIIMLTVQCCVYSIPLLVMNCNNFPCAMSSSKLYLQYYFVLAATLIFIVGHILLRWTVQSVVNQTIFPDRFAVTLHYTIRQIQQEEGDQHIVEEQRNISKIEYTEHMHSFRDPNVQLIRKQSTLEQSHQIINITVFNRQVNKYWLKWFKRKPILFKTLFPQFFVNETFKPVQTLHSIIPMKQIVLLIFHKQKYAQFILQKANLSLMQHIFCFDQSRKFKINNKIIKISPTVLPNQLVITPYSTIKLLLIFFFLLCISICSTFCLIAYFQNIFALTSLSIVLNYTTFQLTRYINSYKLVLLLLATIIITFNSGALHLLILYIMRPSSYLLTNDCFIVYISSLILILVQKFLNINFLSLVQSQHKFNPIVASISLLSLLFTTVILSIEYPISYALGGVVLLFQWLLDRIIINKFCAEVIWSNGLLHEKVIMILQFMTIVMGLFSYAQSMEMINLVGVGVGIGYILMPVDRLLRTHNYRQTQYETGQFVQRYSTCLNGNIINNRNNQSAIANDKKQFSMIRGRKQSNESVKLRARKESIATIYKGEKQDQFDTEMNQMTKALAITLKERLMGTHPIDYYPQEDSDQMYFQYQRKVSYEEHSPSKPKVPPLFFKMKTQKPVSDCIPLANIFSQDTSKKIKHQIKKSIVRVNKQENQII